MDELSWRGVLVTLVLSLAAYVSFSLAADAPHPIRGDAPEAPPPDQLLTAQGGGSYVPGTLEVLRARHDPATDTTWRLVRYATTVYDCLEARVYVSGSPSGDTGGCGFPSPMPTWFVSSGGVTTVRGETMIVYGRAASEVASVTAWLEDGSSSDDTPVDGWFLIAAPPGSSVIRVETHDAEGNVTQRSAVSDPDPFA